MSDRKKRKYLSEGELQILLSQVKRRADLARERGTTRAIIDELIVLLSARAGLRANEIRALKIEDIPTVHGERALRIRNAMGEVIRVVDVSEDVAQLLRRFVRLYRKGAKRKDSLLQSERGSPFGYMSLYSKVRRIGEQAGIGRLTPAMLQHTYMVCLYELERDLRYVQEQTGYVSRRTLTNYLTSGRDKKTSTKQAGAELAEQGPAEQEGTHLEPTRTCEACGTMFATGRGRRIESGQFLCHKCLEHFGSGQRVNESGPRASGPIRTLD